jgi:hypothetical protein
LRYQSHFVWGSLLSDTRKVSFLFLSFLWIDKNLKKKEVVSLCVSLIVCSFVCRCYIPFTINKGAQETDCVTRDNGLNQNKQWCSYQSDVTVLKKVCRDGQIQTPNRYDYNFALELSDPSPKFVLRFEVQASNDAHVSFSTGGGNDGVRMELPIGGWGNQVRIPIHEFGFKTHFPRIVMTLGFIRICEFCIIVLCVCVCGAVDSISCRTTMLCVANDGNASDR